MNSSLKHFNSVREKKKEQKPIALSCAINTVNHRRSVNDIPLLSVCLFHVVFCLVVEWSINTSLAFCSSYHLDVLAFLLLQVLQGRERDRRTDPNPKPRVIDFLSFRLFLARDRGCMIGVCLFRTTPWVGQTAPRVGKYQQWTKTIECATGKGSVERGWCQCSVSSWPGGMFLSIGSPEILLFPRDKPAIATRMKRRSSKMCWINRLDRRTPSKSRCPTALRATRARVNRWQGSWSANANDIVSGTGNWRVWERSRLHEIHRLRRCCSRRMCRWSSRSVSSKTKPTNCDRTISSSTKRSNSCKPIQ